MGAGVRSIIAGMSSLTDPQTPEQMAHATVTWLLAGAARGEHIDGSRWETSIVACITAALDEQREAIARMVEAGQGTAAEMAARIRSMTSKPRR